MKLWTSPPSYGENRYWLAIKLSNFPGNGLTLGTTLNHNNLFLLPTFAALILHVYLVVKGAKGVGVREIVFSD